MIRNDRKRLNELKAEIRAAYDRAPLDLLVKDVRLVNVYSGTIVTTNIGVKNGRVVTISGESPKHSPVEVIDGEGRYAIPGLIDAHVHIETTLLTPPALAEVIVPHGTTTMLIDPMEISNVAGLDGLLAFIRGIEDLPYRIFIEVSSRVPTAPGLETTGGALGIKETERLLDRDHVGRCRLGYSEWCQTNRGRAGGRLACRFRGRLRLPDRKSLQGF